jgi:predicted amino acid dehydrogenase
VIGNVCAQILAREVPELTLIGRRADALETVREQCEGFKAKIKTSLDIRDIYDADLILTVTSATTSIIEPEHLKPGTVVCDVARPRDVSIRVAKVRDDVLVIEGGMVEVPGPVDFHFNFGFPPGKSYACMAETMVLALEGRFQDYSVGKHISLDQVNEIGGLAAKHGFRLSGFRSFERAVTDEHIERVRERAQAQRK